MLVKGIFNEGRPQISGLLVFPSLCGLTQVSVNFLVDSGADRSVITVNEYKDYFSYPDTCRYPLAFSSGFGGGVITRLVPARLGLRDQDGGYSLHPLVIEVPNPKKYDKTIPSVMGRDLLNRFRLTIDRTDEIVTLTEPSDVGARHNWLCEGEEELGADFDGMTMSEALAALENAETYPGLKT